ncbi:3'-5' exonuclease [Verminephrobacter eiseniae]|uniref:3'-5' exonuclease n=1 Tax=Verminephrobacter eiseniae TaxID=364317 RepID=UPI00223730AC|nr:3'-5' exonuclease [Verminephrobacter eiseniae]MCW5260883.1 3'-5' exonuclease [Verminephrobacter eiseniae]
MTALIFGTKTTGLHEPAIVQAAWLMVKDPFTLTVVERFEQRYNPGKPIELGALATHHILDEELADCPPASGFSLPPGTEYLIGHDVDYDWQVIGAPPVKRICTLALARWLLADIDSHTQAAMLYLFERGSASSLLQHAHSARHDVMHCAIVLEHLLARMGDITEATTWQTLWQRSEQARIPKTLTFGKHKGLATSAAPSDYKHRLLHQPDVDPYLTRALRGEAA